MLPPVAPSRSLYFSTWAMVAVYTHRKQQWFWDIFGLGGLFLSRGYFLSMKHVCDAGIADLKHQHSYAVATCCSNSYKIVLYRDNSIHIVDIVVHRAVTTTTSWVLCICDLKLMSRSEVRSSGTVSLFWGWNESQPPLQTLTAWQPNTFHSPKFGNRTSIDKRIDL